MTLLLEPKLVAALGPLRRIRVVHFSSGHLMPDTRVLHKECRTLVEQGYDVALVVRHPKDEVLNGVRIVAVHEKGRPSRLRRVTTIVWKVYRTADRLKADIYHFHDPELLPAGLLLKMRGHTVIYDAHEAFSRKLMSKPWLPRMLRRPIAACYAWLERRICRALDHVIAADRTTAMGFPGSRVTVVANYPILTEAQRNLPIQKAEHDRRVLLYAGGLEADRGIAVMLDIAERLGDQVELRLLGRWFDPSAQRRASQMANVKYLGLRSLSDVYSEMMNADLGLVLLQPVPAYVYASENTNKIFEYMACGLPVVASDFAAFKTLIAQTRSGICVDPTNAATASEEILRLLRDSKLREEMGRRGLEAVLSHYNWQAEQRKLLAVYKELEGSWQKEHMAASIAVD